jgi:hypothetical protein
MEKSEYSSRGEQIMYSQIHKDDDDNCELQLYETL